MKDIGLKINKMDMEYRNGLMGASIRVNLNKAKNMVKDFMSGLMAASMQEDGTKIYCMAKENTNGKTEDIIRGSG